MASSPPFTLNPLILTQALAIEKLVGELKSATLVKPSVKLRKENKIKTVHHNLAIEGNSLTEAQITAILEHKRVLGSEKEIQEVKNALKLYEELGGFNPYSEKDLFRAHKTLMQILLSKGVGTYRNQNVGVLKGSQVSHMAPPAKNVPSLMSDLFAYLKKKDDIPLLIKACVFHYELEFIHPFLDGNGRMGRLWQQLILMKHSPIFEFISVETHIHQRQKEYYAALEECDREGESTVFIEFSLKLIRLALEEFKEHFRPKKLTSADRIEQARLHFQKESFSRRDYMGFFADLSSATASRDLAQAVESGRLVMTGDKRLAVYRFKTIAKTP